MNPFLEIAIEAAREAGRLLLAEFDRPQRIEYKGEADLVTEADRRSEEAIVTRLRNHFPQHSIVGEEGGGERNGSRYCWYVDPLDGTTNFAHGYPCFCVSLGLLEDGEPLVGVIFNPVSRELFTAARGQGAFLDSKPIRVSRVPELRSSLLVTGFPNRKRVTDPNILYYWNYTLRSHGVRRDGSAALDLAFLACGRFDGFWEFGLNPWDTAAGVLLVREAGGLVTDFAGQPYRITEAADARGNTLLASNGLIHAEMQAVAADVAAHRGTPLPVPLP